MLAVNSNRLVWDLTDEALLAEVGLSPARDVVAHVTSDEAALAVPVGGLSVVALVARDILTPKSHRAH
jgi:hypothetical protein